MKKIHLFLLAFAGITFSSCLEDKNELHFFAMPVPNGPEAKLYADQERDSMVIVSTDSWVLTPQKGDWMDFSQTSLDIKPGYQATTVIDLAFPANDTGENRSVEAWVKADGRSYMKKFTQVSYMNIQRPDMTLTPGEEAPEYPEFELTDSSYVTKDSIIFISYAKKIEIASNAEWLVPERTVIERQQDTKQPRKYTVLLALEPNNTQEKREAELVLSTSNNCLTVIKVHQLPKKK
jgi:hypothetical protein